MNGNFIKLLEQLELEQKKDTYQGTLKDIIVNKADHSWFFDIELQRPLDIEDFKELKEREIVECLNEDSRMGKIYALSEKGKEIKHSVLKLGE